MTTPSNGQQLLNQLSNDYFNDVARQPSSRELIGAMLAHRQQHDARLIVKYLHTLARQNHSLGSDKVTDLDYIKNFLANIQRLMQLLNQGESLMASQYLQLIEAFNKSSIHPSEPVLSQGFEHLLALLLTAQDELSLNQRLHLLVQSANFNLSIAQYQNGLQPHVTKICSDLKALLPSQQVGLFYTLCLLPFNFSDALAQIQFLKQHEHDLQRLINQLQKIHLSTLSDRDYDQLQLAIQIVKPLTQLDSDVLWQSISADPRFQRPRQVKSSNMQKQVVQELKAQLKAEQIDATIHEEVMVNGLAVDIQVGNLYIQVDGPSHFQYDSHGQSYPRPKEAFHDAIIRGEG